MNKNIRETLGVANTKWFKRPLYAVGLLQNKTYGHYIKYVNDKEKFYKFKSLRIANLVKDAYALRDNSLVS